jgi:hypothetical protein
MEKLAELFDEDDRGRVRGGHGAVRRTFAGKYAPEPQQTRQAR